MRYLEIRLLRFGCGVDLQIEVIRVVLGAGPFLYRPQVAARIALAHVPWGGEGHGVFDMDLHLQGLAALDNPEALDDMKLLSVGRSVIIDERFGRQPNRIDDKRIVFVMANRFPIPGGLDRKSVV